MWNKCDICGKFIAHEDFENGARRQLIVPDNHFGIENFETLCIKCNKGDPNEKHT